MVEIKVWSIVGSICATFLGLVINPWRRGEGGVYELLSLKDSG